MNRASEKDCGCGHAAEPNQSECCGLAPLVRPNFVAGQMLRAPDLARLVDYTRRRDALQVYKTGWGVTCGLGISIENTDGKPPIISVSPGHAVDPCGRDILVDRCMLVRMPEDPRAVKSKCKEEQNALPAPAETQVDDPCAPTGWDVFDLLLTYHGRPSEPRPRSTPAECGTLPPCEYARTVESFKLDIVPACACGGCTDSAPLPSLPWDVGSLVDELMVDGQNFKGVPDLRTEVLNWVEAKAPKRRKGFEAVKSTSWRLSGTTGARTFEVDRDDVVRSVVNVALDEVTIRPRCNPPSAVGGCPCAVESDGVPLARVYLQRDEWGAFKRATASIGLSHRRALRRDPWPSRCRKFSMDFLIGLSLLDARAWLNQAGVSSYAVDFERAPERPDIGLTTTACDALCQLVVLVTIDKDCDKCARVAGITTYPSQFAGVLQRQSLTGFLTGGAEPAGASAAKKKPAQTKTKKES